MVKRKSINRISSLMGVVLFFVLFTIAQASEMGGQIAGTINGINPEEPNALGQIVNENLVLQPFLDEGLITDDEFNSFTNRLRDLANQWLDHQMNNLDPTDPNELRVYLDLQMILDAGLGGVEDFWSEEDKDHAHAAIRHSASKWLINIVDGLDPDNPDFSQFADLLLLQTADFWEEKFSAEARAYKEEMIKKKMDEWLINRAKDMTTLADFEEMRIFQTASFHGYDFGNLFGNEAKQYKEEKLKEKFGKWLDKQLKKDDADIPTLADIARNYCPPLPQEVCDKLDAGDKEGARKALKGHKQGFFAGLWNGLRNLFVQPDPLDMETPTGEEDEVRDTKLDEEDREDQVQFEVDPSEALENKTCGNGQPDAGEECDPGADEITCKEGTYCTETCECKDVNSAPSPFFDYEYEFEPYSPEWPEPEWPEPEMEDDFVLIMVWPKKECGDGTLDPGLEECDPKSSTAAECPDDEVCVNCKCVDKSTVVPKCGDGYISDPPEQCDPKAPAACDEPKQYCDIFTCQCVQKTPRCGDGWLYRPPNYGQPGVGGEECDPTAQEKTCKENEICTEKCICEALWEAEDTESEDSTDGDAGREQEEGGGSSGIIIQDAVKFETLPVPQEEEDEDEDSIPDYLDNCPSTPNVDQADDDDDGVGDVCDPEPTDEGDEAEPEPTDEEPAPEPEPTVDEGPRDFDNDGTPDTEDNCPAVANPDQLDSDGDGQGDSCDMTPLPPTTEPEPEPEPEAEPDSDGDGIPDNQDNCPSAHNSDQTDSDGDGIGDLCDSTPAPPPAGPTDSDGDGHPDTSDNCPGSYNPDQMDSDGDGIGDPCDSTPAPPPAGPTDSDGDGHPDTSDNCPESYNPDQMDSDGDGIGDPCDSTPLPSEPDMDGDGIPDGEDNCPDVPNPDQIDADGNGVGDACDAPPPEPDIDQDGVPDSSDNCPDLYNPDQMDSDGDLIGDACDEPEPEPDSDGDGVFDFDDNCPFTPNPDQLDSNQNGIGDACDDPTAPLIDPTGGFSETISPVQ